MKKAITHKFVELIPDELEYGVLYISIPHGVAIHKCICGCGNEVVPPISPSGWQLWYDGETASLTPSIGDWNFQCQSHYWIKRNETIYAEKWDKNESQDRRSKKKKQKAKLHSGKSENGKSVAKMPQKKRGWRQLLKSLISFF